MSDRLSFETGCEALSEEAGIVNRCAAFLAILAFATGCVSTGTLGIISKSGANPTELITGTHPYKELGFASGSSCRYFALAIIPFGDASVSTAVDDALKPTGGDALLNASVSSSLFGFIPYYNIFAFTCTSVKGIAIRLEPPAPETSQ